VREAILTCGLQGVTMVRDEEESVAA
jgi:hypothetical protein